MATTTTAPPPPPLPPPSSASPSSSNYPPPPTTTTTRTNFSPIQEFDGNSATPLQQPQRHHPTPINHITPKAKKGRPSTSSSSSSAVRKQSADADEDCSDGSVKCNKCRPHAREKITVVPLDHTGAGLTRHTLPSPNGILKSILSSLTKKSPRPGSDRSDASSREEQWKIALAELSHKLIQATRRRDEAVLEASRLKHSVAELERKLNKLEIFCHNFSSGLEECTTAAATGNSHLKTARAVSLPNEQVIDRFLGSVSEARSAVRVLSRSLTMQLRYMGPKVFDKLSQLLQPYDIKISPSQSPKTLVFYIEAVLNRAFYEDFESARFEKNRASVVLNPTDRCGSNLASFDALRGLTWDDVLSKGTKHFSEDFSRFCDRKMSEIVGMLGWARAWPEPLLQAFFGASKAVWLVHLLANSVHPGLPIMRVDSGARFESGYMEDTGADRARKLVPGSVRIMVAPGFYVSSSVVKCKVLCRYYGSSSINMNGGVISRV